jgi:hypothetical protein
MINPLGAPGTCLPGCNPGIPSFNAVGSFTLCPAGIFELGEYPAQMNPRLAAIVRHFIIANVFICLGT